MQNSSRDFAGKMCGFAGRSRIVRLCRYYLFSSRCFSGFRAGSCFLLLLSVRLLWFRNNPRDRHAVLVQDIRQPLIANAVNAVCKVTRRLGNADGPLFHKIRLSDFMCRISRPSSISSQLLQQLVKILKPGIFNDHLATAVMVLDSDLETQTAL